MARSHLSRARRLLAPARGVCSDGWEHIDSDIVSIHDCTSEPES